jgi:hypothetical protein
MSVGLLIPASDNQVHQRSSGIHVFQERRAARVFVDPDDTASLECVEYFARAPLLTFLLEGLQDDRPGRLGGRRPEWSLPSL